MPYMKNPLLEAHCNDLDFVIQRYPPFKEVLEKLERCGLPCREQLDALEAAFNICKSIKAEFNPLAGAPPPMAENYQPIKLNERQCKDLDSVISEYPGLKETIAAFERCGIPCADAKDSLERHFHVCSSLKREFSPESV